MPVVRVFLGCPSSHQIHLVDTVPNFNRRIRGEEMMDDFSITDARLTHALNDLRGVNRWLGGHAATQSALVPLLRRSGTLRVIDLGTGGADYPEHLVRWAARHGHRVEVVAVDANPHTVAYAQTALDRRLPATVRARVEVVRADALDLPYPDDAFDVAVAALFLHHFPEEEGVALLREMDRVARRGLIVNDLHRHPIAYYGVRAIGALTRASEMFRHDGPVSVRRGFRRGELLSLAAAAGLQPVRIRWHWAFRWVMSTIDTGESTTGDA